MRLLLLALLSPLCTSQPGGLPVAACYGGGTLKYGAATQSYTGPGVASWSDFRLCWTQAQAHFANNTVVGQFNLTMVEKYSIFTLVIDAKAKSITVPVSEPSLTFDADIIAPGAIPEVGSEPFQLLIILPAPLQGGSTCPIFELSHLSLHFTLHQQHPRVAGRKYAGWQFGISGCGRETQTVCEPLTSYPCTHY